MVDSKKSTTKESGCFNRVNESTVRRVVANPYMKFGGLFLSDKLLRIGSGFIAEIAFYTVPCRWRALMSLSRHFYICLTNTLFNG